jgi:hypothetical protein
MLLWRILLRLEWREEWETVPDHPAHRVAVGSKRQRRQEAGGGRQEKK